MIKVFQSIIDGKNGDCIRAAVASIFELLPEQVPHFKLYEREWMNIYIHFLMAMGYSWNGNCHLHTKLAKEEFLAGKYADVKSYYIANAPSKTFAGLRHIVVVNKEGVVEHDPNPNGLWLGENLLNQESMCSIDILKRIVVN